MPNITLTPTTIGNGFSAASFNRVELLTLRAHINGLSLDVIHRHYGHITSYGLSALINRAVQTFHAHQKVDRAIALRTFRAGNDESIRKAIWAINDLEKLSKHEPKLDDPVSSWYLPALARRLEKNGITTLRQLCEQINDRGQGFYRPYRGLGPKAARALITWVADHNASLQFEFFDLINPPPLPVPEAPQVIHPGALPVPIERAVISARLSGLDGINRAPLDKNRLAANDDLAAIHTWLSLYSDQSHTFRAYRREAERLLLWCVIERGKALSSLLVEDAQAFKDFLRHPRPTPSDTSARALPNYWCGARTPRSHPRWRPFENGLGDRSIAQAMTIIKALFEWLTRQRYLDTNIFDALPRGQATGRILVERALPKTVWDSFIEWLGTQTDDHTMNVALVAALLAGDAGLRRNEIACLTRQNLIFDEFWELRFTGKRNKDRSVPVSDRLITALLAYHQQHKLAHLVDADAQTPLLYPTARPVVNADKTDDGYCNGSIWRILKLAFKCHHQAHGATANYDLSKAYPHALRHTFGVQAVRAGVDLDVVSQCLGHASLTTTTIYTQGDRKRRSDQLKKLHEEL